MKTIIKYKSEIYAGIATILYMTSLYCLIVYAINQSF